MTDLSQVNERRKTSVSLFMPTGRRGFNKYGLHKRSVKKCIELLNWNIACTYVRTFFSTKKTLSGVFLRSFSSLEYFNKKKQRTLLQTQPTTDLRQGFREKRNKAARRCWWKALLFYSMSLLCIFTFTFYIRRCLLVCFHLPCFVLPFNL